MSRPLIKQQLNHSEKILFRFLPADWAGGQPTSQNPPELSKWLYLPAPQTEAFQVTPASTSSSAPAHQAFQTAAFASARSSLCGSSFPQHLTSSTWIQQRVQVEEEFNEAENRADLVLWLSWIHIFKPVMLSPASPSSSRTLLKSPCHC